MGRGENTGESRFVRPGQRRAGQECTRGVPRAAKANRPLFFDRKEAARAKAKPLSVAEVQGRVGPMIYNRVARYASVKTEFASAQVTSEQVP